MRPIRLLGIAPYEELNHSMNLVAQQFDSLSIDVFNANLQEGRDLAIQLAHDDYDAVISRGGTAHLIQDAVDIPVIDVSISVYDILSSIKLAYNYSQNIAIVGYESITKNAHLICDVLQYNIKIITIDQPEQTADTLIKLKEEGCELVLCDAITNHTALRLSLNTILITSGLESIKNAYQQAITFTKYIQKIETQRNLLQEVLSKQALATLVLDQDFKPVSSNLPAKLTHTLIRFLKKQKHLDNQQLYHTHKGQTYQVKSNILTLNEQTYYHCELKMVTPPLIHQQFGVTFSSRSAIEDTISQKLLFASFIQEKNLVLMSQLLKHYNAMMIFGEEGTAKTSLAYSCFLKFQYHTANLISINCKLFGERLWKYLSHTSNSPLLYSGNTILFQHCEQLSLEDLRKLLELIKSSNLLQRQNIIFTYTTKKADPDKLIFKEIMQELNCATLYSSSLSERHTELASIITLLLNKANIECHTQVIGFEPQAMHTLQEFQWTGNFYQLERVIKKLILSANSYYILENAVIEVLSEERRHQNHLQLNPSNHSKKYAPAIIEEKSLFDYSQDIVRTVLEYNKGNQTKTAKQLGISRTTLWRYLKIK